MVQDVRAAPALEDEAEEGVVVIPRDVDEDAVVREKSGAGFVRVRGEGDCGVGFSGVLRKVSVGARSGLGRWI